MPEVTLFYAGVLGLMNIVLAFQVGKLRGKTEISIGDGGNQALLVAMRRHANFIEFAPLVLIIIALLELNGASSMSIHITGILLVVFRIAHAVGFQADTIEGKARVVGAAGTALLTVIVSIWAIVRFFS